MLRINKLKIEIETINGKLVFSESFHTLVNIVCSENNTTGKSSIISAIYYALGLEEIIGGKGAKVLTPAFKNSIIEGNNSLDVLESKIFLEISNGSETITVYRVAKSISRKENLITVYKGPISDINYSSSEDMYVHLKNAATNEKGFHYYLTQFLNLDLPKVATNDDKERQLYIQLIFSCLFIEQKRGWSDLFSGMPHFGIKEPKKRVIEFILNLDVHKNEKLKHQLKTTYKTLTSQWSSVFVYCKIKVQTSAKNLYRVLHYFCA